MQNRFTIYRKLVNAIKTAKSSQNLDSIIQEVNVVVSLHKHHKADIDELCKQEKFENINGLDFNVWAWDTLAVIETAANIITDAYYSIHWEQKGFNVY
jgi:hypothetical protein